MSLRVLSSSPASAATRIATRRTSPIWLGSSTATAVVPFRILTPAGTTHRQRAT